MQSRFSSVRFPLPFETPLVGKDVGYAFIFIPLYIFAKVAFVKAKGYWKKKVPS